MIIPCAKLKIKVSRNSAEWFTIRGRDGYGDDAREHITAQRFSENDDVVLIRESDWCRAAKAEENCAVLAEALEKIISDHAGCDFPPDGDQTHSEECIIARAALDKLRRSK